MGCSGDLRRKWAETWAAARARSGGDF